jgi:hypothetical protein
MMDQTRMALAGWACLASGVILAAGSLLASRPPGGMLGTGTTPLVLVFAQACAAGLSSGTYALARLLPRPHGRGSSLAIYPIYAGLAAWVLGGLLPGVQADELLWIIAIGGALQSAGLIALGATPRSANRLPARLGLAMLLAGAWFPAALALQLAFFAVTGAPPCQPCCWAAGEWLGRSSARRCSP